MVVVIESLADIANRFDAIVFDQWGVLHNGSAPYAGVPEAIAALAPMVRLGVLSNSGKRSAPNLERITGLGYGAIPFDVVMTSGEAFFSAVKEGDVAARAFFSITAKPDDAANFATGLDIRLVPSVTDAEAILLMGLPEGSDGSEYRTALNKALARKLPVYCTNPDLVSPRADGRRQVSPGSLGQHYADQGGVVTWYGKPHRPIFSAVEHALGVSPERLLMVGDSLAHDIAGAKNAGWSALFVQGGNYWETFQTASDPVPLIVRLANDEETPLPDYTLMTVQ